MIIECLSCHFSAEVDDAKIPLGGANTTCPRCATIFFVAAPERSSIYSVDSPITFQKSSLDCNELESCNASEPVSGSPRAAKDRADKQPLSGVNRQRCNQRHNGSLGLPIVLDAFQRSLLVLGLLGIIVSLISAIYLTHSPTNQLGNKSGVLATLVGMLPTIGIAEAIFGIFVLYSYKKRHHISQLSLKSNCKKVERRKPYVDGIKATVKDVAIYLVMLAIITGFIAIVMDSRNADVGIFTMCIYMAVFLIITSPVGYILKKTQNIVTLYVLTYLVMCFEILSFAVILLTFVLSQTGMFIFPLLVVACACLPFLVFKELKQTCTE